MLGSSSKNWYHQPRQKYRKILLQEIHRNYKKEIEDRDVCWIGYSVIWGAGKKVRPSVPLRKQPIWNNNGAFYDHFRGWL